jgi:hypothetical protein
MIDINDKISVWHTTNGEMPLHVFLGMMWHEYTEFVKTGDIPERLKQVYC